MAAPAELFVANHRRAGDRCEGGEAIKGGDRLGVVFHGLDGPEVPVPRLLELVRLDGLGQAYYRKKKAQGMTYYEAMRCLKRRLVRVVYSHLHTDQDIAMPCLQAAA